MKSNKNLDFSILLSILNYIIKVSSNNTKRIKYNNSAISCFINIVNVAAENDAIDNCVSLFDEITNFFIENNKFDDKSNEMIKILFNKLIKQGEFQLNCQTLNFISMISIILMKNPNLLKKDIIESIIEKTKSFIFDLNSIFLTLFYNSESCINKDTFISIYHQLLTKWLINLDKTNEKSIIKQNNDSNIKISFDSNKFKELFAPEILSIIMQIEKLITFKEEYSLFFLLTTIDNIHYIQSNLNDIFYIKYSIILYLISSIISKYPNISISKEIINNVFINDLLFNQSVN